MPGDLSVIGFDDFQIASLVWPPLTTIRAPTREVGRLAAGKLLGHEDPERRDPADRLPSLVVRESTSSTAG